MHATTGTTTQIFHNVVTYHMRMIQYRILYVCQFVLAPLPWARPGWEPCMYACVSQDDPWYVVSRLFNITKLRELGMALNTTRRGEWR